MTPEQEKIHFETFGFVVKRQLFKPEEMARFSRWYDEGFDAACGPYDGTGYSQSYTPGIGLHPGFCEHYLDDSRILDALDNLMGPGFLFVGSDAQRFAGDTPWHQDAIIPMEVGREDEFLMLKAIMYLDDASAGPGSLQIIPYSHRRGLRESLRQVLRIEDGTNPIWAGGMTAAGVPPQEVPGAVAVRTRPGDIVFFNHKCFHSSWGGKTGRRYQGMNFAAQPTKPWHVKWLSYNLRQGGKVSLSNRFPEPLLKTKKPHLRRLVDFVLELCEPTNGENGKTVDSWKKVESRESRVESGRKVDSQQSTVDS